MKKILLSLAVVLCLSSGLYAEDQVITVQPVDNDLITELRKDCEKIVAATQTAAVIEEVIQQHQAREQELLTRFMTRGFTKDKFEMLGKKISTMCIDKQDHDAIVAELMKNPAYKLIAHEIEQLASLVEELYDVMIKAAAVQSFAKEVLDSMQIKIDTLMTQGYTQDQLTELIQNIITEISQQHAEESTQKNISDNA